jgi:hypothetical protein
MIAANTQSGSLLNSKILAPGAHRGCLKWGRRTHLRPVCNGSKSHFMTIVSIGLYSQLN